MLSHEITSRDAKAAAAGNVQKLRVQWWCAELVDKIEQAHVNIYSLISTSLELIENTQHTDRNILLQVFFVCLFLFNIYVLTVPIWYQTKTTTKF